MGYRDRLISEIKKAIIGGIQRNGERIFHRSQQTQECFVPVDRGTLKRSGYTNKLVNGVEIGYTAPYASRVEAGGPATPYKGTQVVKVRGYTRRAYTRKDGVYVPPVEVSSHEVKYVNKRLVGFKPKLSKFERGPLIFRVLKEEPAREGQWFLKRSLVQEIKHLPEDIEFHLLRLARVKRAT